MNFKKGDAFKSTFETKKYGTALRGRVTANSNSLKSDWVHIRVLEHNGNEVKEIETQIEYKYLIKI